MQHSYLFQDKNSLHKFRKIHTRKHNDIGVGDDRKREFIQHVKNFNEIFQCNSYLCGGVTQDAVLPEDEYTIWETPMTVD